MTIVKGNTVAPRYSTAANAYSDIPPLVPGCAILWETDKGIRYVYTIIYITFLKKCPCKLTGLRTPLWDNCLSGFWQGLHPPLSRVTDLEFTGMRTVQFKSLHNIRPDRTRQEPAGPDTNQLAPAGPGWSPHQSNFTTTFTCCHNSSGLFPWGHTSTLGWGILVHSEL